MKVYAIRTKHTVAALTIYSNLAMQTLLQKGPVHSDGALLCFLDRGYEMTEISEDEAYKIINEKVEQHDFGYLTENRLVAQDIAKFKEDGYISFGGMKEIPYAGSSNVSTTHVGASKTTDQLCGESHIS